MNKQFFSMLSLGVFSVAVAGFGLPAEGGLFDFFRHHSSRSTACDCAPCGHVAQCAPACGHYDNDYDDDDDGWCGHRGYGACDAAVVCAPAPVCACPPPVAHSYCGYSACDYDDDDGDYDDDDDGHCDYDD